jgi:hypothetical protein
MHPYLNYRYTGEMGVVAVLPMIAFFGFGVLNKVRYNDINIHTNVINAQTTIIITIWVPVPSSW